MAPFVSSEYALVFLSVLFSLAMHVAHGNNDAPPLFIFGDSTFDVGTNNVLRSGARANFPYNGIDFYHSLPTGRFSNGFNTADQIARLLGYQQSPPPFLTKKNEFNSKNKILKGVNFASGGSGILPETGSAAWGEVVFFEKQVKQFALVRASLNGLLGYKADSFVSKSLFLISVGSNDLFDFASNHSGSIRLNAEQYLGLVQVTYYSHLKKLYDLGARKFGIISVAPIGCCPAITSGNGGQCVKALNDFAVAFHSATQVLLQKLSSELDGFRYSLADSFVMTTILLNISSSFGLKETKAACCGSGYLNGQGGCIKAQNASLCNNREEFLFWDWFHPTEKVSELAAKTIFEGGNDFVSPINFSQLASSY
ncbi:hypothetical protein PHAVU_003G267900 [Phaseolus vulgaris]|uniref:GDSL esterase/lipase n=1 Tax=Phaseolus vulgaris TaxID=3885 RepID=V7CDL4_PHAVU|nr:hypothetical protein PHAVU_003G267900g [Phaseolus vulgaris]ESW28209.1 hypothetical protein PHAVU_003G267900g [Phaseolus vulgaris]